MTEVSRKEHHNSQSSTPLPTIFSGGNLSLSTVTEGWCVSVCVCQADLQTVDGRKAAALLLPGIVVSAVSM